MSESNIEPQPEVDPPTLPPPPPIEAAIPPPPPIVPVLAPDFQGRRLRPLLGPSLWIFGTLLWAQLVFGTFIVAKDMPESYAVLGVLLAVTLAWVLSVKHRQDVKGFAFRHVAPLIVALSFWAGAMLFALLVATVTGGDAVGFLLGLIGIIALFVGRRFAGPPRQAATLLRKALIGLLWVLAALTSFVAAVMYSDL